MSRNALTSYEVPSILLAQSRESRRSQDERSTPSRLATASSERPVRNGRRPRSLWGTAFVVAIILYVLVQPYLNERFQWQLPGIPGLSQTTSERSGSKPEDSAEVASGSGSRTPSVESNAGREPDRSDETSEQVVVEDLGAGLSTTAGKQSSSEQTGGRSGQGATRGTPPSRGPPSEDIGAKNGGDLAAGDLRDGRGTENFENGYRFLRVLGNGVYESPAGLRYTRGSAEGHRLKHVERHLSDQPDRPGKHGVFEGEMSDVLAMIDEAYQLGQQGHRSAKIRNEQDRSIYEVSLNRRVGFVGGRDGNRQGRPAASRIRLVLEEKRVITAFPY